MHPLYSNYTPNFGTPECNQNHTNKPVSEYLSKGYRLIQDGKDVTDQFMVKISDSDHFSNSY